MENYLLNYKIHYRNCLYFKLHNLKCKYLKDILIFSNCGGVVRKIWWCRKNDSKFN